MAAVGIMKHAISSRGVPARLRMDSLKTFGLIMALTGVASLVGWLALGGFGLLLGAMIVVFSVVGLRAPDALVMRMMGAQPLSPRSLPRVQAMLQQLSERAGIATPRLYFSPDPSANAMAVGQRQHGSIAITSGLLQLLSPRELKGVLAHELAHLATGDTESMRLAGSVSNAALSLLRVATWGAFFMLLFSGAGIERLLSLSILGLIAPPLIGALRTAISREREFHADEQAARLTGDPQGLAYALGKLEWQNRAHNKLALIRRRTPPWLNSHPATEQRIARLIEMDAPLFTPISQRQLRVLAL